MWRKILFALLMAVLGVTLATPTYAQPTQPRFQREPSGRQKSDAYRRLLQEQEAERRRLEGRDHASDPQGIDISGLAVMAWTALKNVAGEFADKAQESGHETDDPATLRPGGHRPKAPAKPAQRRDANRTPVAIQPCVPETLTVVSRDAEHLKLSVKPGATLQDIQSICPGVLDGYDTSAAGIFHGNDAEKTFPICVEDGKQRFQNGRLEYKNIPEPGSSPDTAFYSSCISEADATFTIALQARQVIQLHAKVAAEPPKLDDLLPSPPPPPPPPPDDPSKVAAASVTGFSTAIGSVVSFVRSHKRGLIAFAIAGTLLFLGIRRIIRNRRRRLQRQRVVNPVVPAWPLPQQQLQPRVVLGAPPATVAAPPVIDPGALNGTPDPTLADPAAQATVAAPAANGAAPGPDPNQDDPMITINGGGPPPFPTAVASPPNDPAAQPPPGGSPGPT